MTTSSVGKSNHTNFDFSAANPDKNGKVGGLMYEKFEKKTGQTKLTNAGTGLFSHLHMKAKGYTLMTEKTARDYILTKVATMKLPSDLGLQKYQSINGATEIVVTAEAFMKCVKDHQQSDLQVFQISLQMLLDNLQPKSS